MVIKRIISAMVYLRSMLSFLGWESFLVRLESHSTFSDHWQGLVSWAGGAGHGDSVLFVSWLSSEVEVLGHALGWGFTGHAWKGNDFIGFVIDTEFGVKFVFHLTDQSFVIVGDLLGWDGALFASGLFFHFGFNLDYNYSNGMGLKNMEKRVKMILGTFAIESKINVGTKITITLPI